MGCTINPLSPPVQCKFHHRKPELRPKTTCFSSSSFGEEQEEVGYTSTTTEANSYTVSFKTQRDCKLGISRYPDFEYNAEGGRGTGSGSKVTDNIADNELFVSFDLETLYIPPLTSSTTKFLGLPLPPFLKIDIVPMVFQGSINEESGKVIHVTNTSSKCFHNNPIGNIFAIFSLKVELEFKAKFLFSAASVYKAPPLLVKTVLTSEESKGAMKSGRGKRLDEEGKCRLVGVATVDPIDDFLMNSFLGLPTECLADLSALMSISGSS